jgi:hypothetical protein
VRENQGRPVHCGDDLRHREGLARSGYAQQYLVLVATFYAADKLANRLGLVAAGLVITRKFEVHG